VPHADDQSEMQQMVAAAQVCMRSQQVAKENTSMSLLQPTLKVHM
jgi:hypothetical protein